MKDDCVQAGSTTVVCAMCAHSIRGTRVLATCGITPRPSFAIVNCLFPLSLQLHVPETGRNPCESLARSSVKTPNIHV